MSNKIDDVSKVASAGRVPRKIANVFRDGRKKLMDVNVPDSVHIKDLEKWTVGDGFVWGAEAAGQVLKLSGAGLLITIEYLVRALEKVFVDNKYLRELEAVVKNSAELSEKNIDPRTGKKNGETSLTRFAKKNPWVAGYVLYYLMLASLTAGAVGGAKTILDDDKKLPKKEVKQDKKTDAVEQIDDAENVEIVPIQEKNDEKKVEEKSQKTAVEQAQDKKTKNTDSNIKKKEETKKDKKVDKVEVEKKEQTSSVERVKTVATDIKYINPNMKKDEFVKQANNEYFPEIVIGLTQLETYYAIPRLNRGEKYATNGVGLTYTYSYDKKGRLKQRRNPKNPKKVKPLSKKQNYEQLKIHLSVDLLPNYLRPALKNKKNINAQQAIALVWAGYQLPAHMDNIANKIETAKNAQQVADAFTYYSGDSKWRSGTLVRRWWCAAYAVGVITIDEIMKLPRDAFSRVNINTIYKNGHFILDKETVNYALKRARGGGHSTVQDFLSDFKVGREILSKAKGRSKKVGFLTQDSSEKDLGINRESMVAMSKAFDSFRDGNYEQAEKLYLQAISKDPDNMEAYSSLALTYKRLGDKYNSLEYYQKSLDIVVKGNARMNANSKLLLDRSVKASTYYNAGVVREKMAEIYLKRGDKNKARDNYKKAIQNYETAFDNAKEIKDEARMEIYSKAQKKAEALMKKVSGEKGKKLAFDSGIRQIHQKNAKKDIFLYGKEFNGNSIA